MSRIRTIKPKFFKHEELFDAEKESGLPLRLAYAGLWCQADREGRFAWHPRELKSDILPYDEVDFSRVLDALATRGWLRKYHVGGRAYGVILSFKDHQVINNREADSFLPSPDEDEGVEPVSTRAPRVNDASTTRLKSAQVEGEGEREQEDSSLRSESGARPKRKPAGSPEFETWYAAYPKHEDRADAERAYVRAIASGATHADLLAGAQRYAVKVRGQEPKYVKHPATW